MPPVDPSIVQALQAGRVSEAFILALLGMVVAMGGAGFWMMRATRADAAARAREQLEALARMEASITSGLTRIHDRIDEGHRATDGLVGRLLDVIERSRGGSRDRDRVATTPQPPL